MKRFVRTLIGVLLGVIGGGLLIYSGAIAREVWEDYSSSVHYGWDDWKDVIKFEGSFLSISLLLLWVAKKLLFPRRETA